MDQQRRTLHGAVSGRAVADLQGALRAIELDPGPDDGVYGPLTEAAVRAFQERAGLPADGIVGPQTWSRIDRGTGGRLADTPLTGDLHVATTGDDVRQAQEGLQAAGFDPGPLDGVFGPRTEQAVRGLQSSQGLQPTGVVDGPTWDALGAAPTKGPEPESTTPETEPEPASPEQASPDPGLVELSNGADAILLEAAETLVPRYLPPGAEPGADLIVIAALQRAYEGHPNNVSMSLLRWLVDSQPEPDLREEARFLGRLLSGRSGLPLELSAVTWNQRNRAVLARAVGFAQATHGRPTVHVRHLLAAALCDPHVGSIGALLGVGVRACRTQLRRDIARFLPDEAPRGWDAILLGASPSGGEEALAAGEQALAGGFNADVVRRRPDRPLVDQLKVENYVQLLAGSIARRETQMPVSIGLFGEWGAGKSYFMLLLRQAVTELSQRGPASKFCADIVHIEFNAWHYSDANLWASLADEIFEQLAAPDTAGDKRPDELRKELHEKSQRRRELEQSADGAERRVVQLRRELEQAVNDRKVSAGAMAAQLAKDAEVADWLKQSNKKLGFDVPEARFRSMAGELFGAVGEANALWKALGRRRWGAAGLLAVLVILLAGSALLVPPDARRWPGAGAVFALAAIAGNVALAVRRARSGLRFLRRAVEKADDLEVEALRAGAEGTTQEVAGALKNAEARVQVLRAQLEEVNAAVGQLGRELAALEPGRRLYRFIAERAASDDYRRQLGIVSMIRKDFEQLVTLMDEWRKVYERPDSHENDDREDRRPIDRIVLYIDDLDRCSPDQVVNVLQAVHLLGALDLFVVVVGVDPRWLLQSLRREYSGILTTAGQPAVGGAGWQSTPQNYLEKIFNIPFVLPAMEASGFAGLLQGMAVAPDPSPAPPAPPPPAIDLTDTPPAPGPESGGQPAPIVVEAGSEIEAEIIGKDLAGDPTRPLETWELDFLTLLAPLVRTPRSAKRMFNLYRIMRSARSADFLGSADGGDYEAVAQLLAILTGFPELMGALLYTPAVEDGRAGGLLHRPGHASWRNFVAGLQPAASTEGARYGWHSDVAGVVLPADVPAWSNLVKALEPVLPHVSVDELRPYQEAAPQIIRFSFLLSPFAATAAPPAARPAPDRPAEVTGR